MRVRRDSIHYFVYVIWRHHPEGQQFPQYAVLLPNYIKMYATIKVVIMISISLGNLSLR
jgi:hypothetical protein